jgi:hypothetical protein
LHCPVFLLFSIPLNMLGLREISGLSCWSNFRPTVSATMHVACEGVRWHKLSRSRKKYQPRIERSSSLPWRGKQSRLQYQTKGLGVRHSTSCAPGSSPHARGLSHVKYHRSGIKLGTSQDPGTGQARGDFLTKSCLMSVVAFHRHILLNSLGNKECSLVASAYARLEQDRSAAWVCCSARRRCGTRALMKRGFNAL